MTSRAHAIELVNFSHGVLVKMLAGFDETSALHQPHPAANHLVWTLGHLALTYDWLAGLIDASAKGSAPEGYGTLFGWDTKPTGERGKYPSLADVRGAFDAAFAGFLSAAKGLGEAEAWSPTTRETKGFATSRVDAVYKGAWHDGWHMGQVADLRRSLGLGSIMGG